MSDKYITIQIRLSFLTRPVTIKQNIHDQLQETIAERKRILEQLQHKSRVARTIDMYVGAQQAA
jgi:hypothetical protein